MNQNGCHQQEDFRYKKHFLTGLIISLIPYFMTILITDYDKPMDYDNLPSITNCTATNKNLNLIKEWGELPECREQPDILQCIQKCPLINTSYNQEMTEYFLEKTIKTGLNKLFNQKISIIEAKQLCPVGSEMGFANIAGETSFSFKDNNQQYHSLFLKKYGETSNKEKIDKKTIFSIGRSFGRLLLYDFLKANTIAFLAREKINFTNNKESIKRLQRVLNKCERIKLCHKNIALHFLISSRINAARFIEENEGQIAPHPIQQLQKYINNFFKINKIKIKLFLPKYNLIDIEQHQCILEDFFSILINEYSDSNPQLIKKIIEDNGQNSAHRLNHSERVRHIQSFIETFGLLTRNKDF